MFFPELNGNIPNFGELLAPSKDIGGASFEKKSPRPHQKEAIKDLVDALSVSGSDVRTQGIMACGTGKTMVALWVAEKLKAEKTLLCEPSLALIAQNLKEWQANARGPRPEILVVCSDQTVVKPNQDDIKVDISDLPARVTSDPREIAQFLKDKSERKILMSTYHSLPLLVKAMEQRDTGRFDLAIADEAHRTASKEDGAFTLFHYQEVIRSRLRLYLTATPKIYEGDNDLKISMDDESIFGKVGHSLPFSRAIEKGLLADYRLVVATLPENYLGATKDQSSIAMKDALKQLAVLKAIEKYNLSKVLSFHSSVARAYAFAESLETTGPKFLSHRSIWVHGVDGTMPASTRSNLLKLLEERPQKALSLISNCRCLTEGIDVPSIDGIVFFDPKSAEADIVQAIGRAIRQSSRTAKAHGTIIVPLVVPSDIESSAFLEGSEYKKVAQVMRALRAHDDRFEVRLRDTLQADRDDEENLGRSRKMEGQEPNLAFNIEALSVEVQRNLSTKILKVGAGIRGDVLTESAIIEAAREYFKLHGQLPTSGSKEPVPGMEQESWNAISLAGQNGFRTLVQGRSLSVILAPLRKEFGPSNALTETAIIEAAKEYFQLYKKIPSSISKEAVPGMPGETWTAINSACVGGLRTLTEGRSLSVILEHLKVELGISLTETAIIKAAREYHKQHGTLPSAKSKESVPGMPNETWGTINGAGQKGLRTLTKGQSLSVIISPLRKELEPGNALKEPAIVEAAKEYHRLYGKFPSRLSKEQVPGMPNESWGSINSAGQGGIRTLIKGRTLSKILAPIKEQYKNREGGK